MQAHISSFQSKKCCYTSFSYVLKRWTRNAKSGAVLEEHASKLPNNSQESLTVRYNSLRQEAIKYVEEGAKSIQIYNVAMDALQEALKKVAAAKNQSPTAAEDGALSNGGNQQLHAAGDIRTVACQSADEEKKIRELTSELESTNQRCEVYRANLLAVLRDMEEQ